MPSIHVDARGRALAFWRQGAELWYAWREPRGRFGRPRALAATSTRPDQAVALAANGVATVAYGVGDGRIAIRRARPGRVFGPPHVTGTPSPDLPDPVVAADDEGRAIVTWHEHAEPERAVLAAFVSGRGAVSEPVPVGRGQFPTVAMNPSGAAVIAWMDHQARPTAAVRPPAGSFLPASTLPLEPSDPLAAIDVLGRAVVAGSRIGGPPPGPGHGGTSFAVADVGGAFGEPRRLDHDGVLAQMLAEPDGAVDLLSFHGNGVTFASRRADGTVLGPDRISPAGACSPAAAVARGGDLLVTWFSSCQGYGVSTRPVVRLRDRRGRFSEPQTVGEAGGGYTRGAITDGDEAIVVYEHVPTRTIHAVVREDRREAALPPVPDIDLDVPDEWYLPDLPDLDVRARCARACRVTPVALLHAGDRTIRATAPTARLLRAERRARLSVPVPAGAREAAEQAAGAGQSVWASVSVVVRGRSPRPQTVTRRIELRSR